MFNPKSSIIKTEYQKRRNERTGKYKIKKIIHYQDGTIRVKTIEKSLTFTEAEYTLYKLNK